MAVNHFKEFDTVADYEAYIQPDDYAKPLVALVDETDTVMFPQGGGGGDCGNPIMKSVDVEDYSGGTSFLVSEAIISVVIPEGITTIPQNTFKDYVNLSSITFPSTLTSILGGAFYGCTSLTSIEIPSRVTALTNNCFYSCTALTSVTLNEGLTSMIGSFVNCTALTTIELPSTITSIGNYTFRYCSSLSTLTIKATTPPTLGLNSVFQDVNLTAIYVPAASVETYKAASGWSDYANIIQAIPA